MCFPHVLIESTLVQEARECLTEHSLSVKHENQQLRRELINMFAYNKQLRERERMLKEQNQELNRLIDLHMQVGDGKESSLRAQSTLSKASSARGTLRSTGTMPRGGHLDPIGFTPSEMSALPPTVSSATFRSR